MKTEFYAIAMMLIFALALLLLIVVPAPVYRGVPAICSTVEFNPDMTPEARKKCRELRSIKY